MKIPQDIRALLLFLVTMGAIGGLIVMAMVTAPIINKYPQVSLRIVVALLLTFVTAKFLFYITEALLVVIGKKSTRAEARIRSAHPVLRRTVIVLAIVAAFVGWYFIFSAARGVFR